jgi:Orn/Lys/Arg decarboxylase-like protein
MCARSRARRYGGGSIETAEFTQSRPHDHEFQVLFAEPEPGAGPAARTVLDRLTDRGLRVITARTREGLRSTIAVHGRVAAATEPSPVMPIPIGAALLSWELFDSPRELAAVIDELQKLSAPPPVVVVSEQSREQDLPAGLAGRTAGTFWLHADSPHFVADQVEWLVRTYALRSQVLGALAAADGAAASPAAELQTGR